MNLHTVQWDEESALWRMRIIRDIDPNDPLIKHIRDGQPWLAWNTPGLRQGLVEFVELESAAAWISPEGDILLYYRPALEYWQAVNFQAACHVQWLEREWPTFGEVALEQLNRIAQVVQQESRPGRPVRRRPGNLPANPSGKKCDG